MKRKIAIIGVISLVLIIIAVWAVPVFAAGSSGSTQTSNQSTRKHKKAKFLFNLIFAQNEAKVDALIAKAQGADKITTDQATMIKDFWTTYHNQFTQKLNYIRLLQSSNGTSVQKYLNKGVAAGKIKKEKAEKMMILWNDLDTK